MAFSRCPVLPLAIFNCSLACSRNCNGEIEFDIKSNIDIIFDIKSDMDIIFDIKSDIIFVTIFDII